MFTGRFNDRVMIVSESMIIALSMSLLIFYNIQIAKIICSSASIPYDLAITPMSLGFGNNIIILLSFVQFILIILFIEKLIPMFIDKLVWG